MPDYDGRGDESVSAGDVLIWIPRAIFAPIYLVSEYVLRKPLGALVTALDHAGIQKLLGQESDFTLLQRLAASGPRNTTLPSVAP